MADEVESVMPEAVCMHPNGYKMVAYAMVGIKPYRLVSEPILDEHVYSVADRIRLEQVRAARAKASSQETLSWTSVVALAFGFTVLAVSRHKT